MCTESDGCFEQESSSISLGPLSFCCARAFAGEVPHLPLPSRPSIPTKHLWRRGNFSGIVKPRWEEGEREDPKCGGDIGS